MIQLLQLKRVQYHTDWIKCKVSGKILTYGMYYYEDDTDGLIVDAIIYREMKDMEAAAKFDYSKLERAASEKEYKELFKQAEKEFLTSTLLDRKIEGGYK